MKENEEEKVKKVKLDLKDLKIESFVTLLSDEEKDAIRGGSGGSWSRSCVAYGQCASTSGDPGTCNQ